MKPEFVKRIFIHSKLDSREIEAIIKSESEKHKMPLEYNDKAFRILSDKENCFVIEEFQKFDCELIPRNTLFLFPFLIPVISVQSY